MAAVVEDEAVPVGVDALAGIAVLVEVRTVEQSQSVFVVGEVGGHPVEDHADAALVEAVDQEHEVLGSPVAAGGGEVAGGLVAPGAVERVLHDRQELDVGEAQRVDVVRQLGCDLAVAQGLPAAAAAPRAQVHLVDGDRRVQRDALAARLHPRLVHPLVVQAPDRRGRPGRALGVEGEGVRLVRHVSADVRDDVVLVVRTRLRPGHEALPDAGGIARLEWIAPWIPAVEVTHHGDAPRIGGPDGEVGARLALPGAGVGAQLLVQTQVGSLVEEIEVLVRQEAGAVARGSLAFPGHAAAASRLLELSRLATRESSQPSA